MSAVEGGGEPTPQWIAPSVREGGELFVPWGDRRTLNSCISGCWMLAGMGMAWWSVLGYTLPKPLPSLRRTKLKVPAK